MMTAVSYRYTGGGFGIRHSHDSLEVLLVHEGEGEFMLGGILHAMSPGMLFFIDAGVEHSCSVTGGAFIRSVVDFSIDDLRGIRGGGFADAILDSFRTAPSPCAVLTVEGLEGMDRRIGLLQDLEGNTDGLGPMHRGFALGELLCQASGLLRRPSPGPYLQAGAFGDPLVKGALSAMNQSMAQWDTGRLAAHLNCGTVTLCRRFKAGTGLTITGYLTLIRIHEACRMLRGTDLPIAEIGRLVGYPDPPWFTTLFSRQVGVPPSVYRGI